MESINDEEFERTNSPVYAFTLATKYFLEKELHLV